VERETGLEPATLCLETPQSFVSKIESGERRFDVLELRQLCAAIEISPLDFARRLEECLTSTAAR